MQWHNKPEPPGPQAKFKYGVPSILNHQFEKKEKFFFLMKNFELKTLRAQSVTIDSFILRLLVFYFDFINQILSFQTCSKGHKY